MAYITNNDNLEIARGNIDRLSGVNKFGEFQTAPNGTEIDVWDGGGTYSFPATALITVFLRFQNEMRVDYPKFLLQKILIPDHQPYLLSSIGCKRPNHDGAHEKIPPGFHFFLPDYYFHSFFIPLIR